jgi:hypothetical protein
LAHGFGEALFYLFVEHKEFRCRAFRGSSRPAKKRMQQERFGSKRKFQEAAARSEALRSKNRGSGANSDICSGRHNWFNPLRTMISRFASCVLAAFVAIGAPAFGAGKSKPGLKTRNVILITTDGLRPNEVFTGADPELMNKQAGGVANTNALAREFWRETAEQRREALMPFLWTIIAKEGQVYGNQKLGSVAQITNNRKFSYPGYNEILTGVADPRIDSNAKIPNGNVTVFEWLHHKRPFQGKVAAFSAWDVMPFIINRERCDFPVMGGWEPVPERKPNKKEDLINELISEMTRQNEAELDDALLFHAAQEYFLEHKPRVMLVSFLETDHWAHSGRYDNVLKSAHRVDAYIRELWEMVQSIPSYRNRTTFIITTDHGRGAAPEKWKSHGASIDGAENIWIAFMGPDTPALGERKNTGRVTQSQIAATLAAFLGEDYQADVPGAGSVIRDVLPN